jgi:hypothetical protein
LRPLNRLSPPRFYRLRCATKRRSFAASTTRSRTDWTTTLAATSSNATSCFVRAKGATRITSAAERGGFAAGAASSRRKAISGVLQLMYLAAQTFFIGNARSPGGFLFLLPKGLRWPYATAFLIARDITEYTCLLRRGLLHRVVERLDLLQKLPL